MPLGTARLIRHTRTASLHRHVNAVTPSVNAVTPSTPLGARALCMPPGKLCRTHPVAAAAATLPENDEDSHLEELLKATLPPPSEGDDLTPEAALAELRKISRAAKQPDMTAPAAVDAYRSSLGGKAARLWT